MTFIANQGTASAQLGKAIPHSAIDVELTAIQTGLRLSVFSPMVVLWPLRPLFILVDYQTSKLDVPVDLLLSPVRRWLRRFPNKILWSVTPSLSVLDYPHQLPVLTHRRRLSSLLFPSQPSRLPSTEGFSLSLLPALRTFVVVPTSRPDVRGRGRRLLPPHPSSLEVS